MSEATGDANAWGRALLAAAGMVAASACGDGSAGGSGADAAGVAVSFADDVRPLFSVLCADCHYTGSPIGYDFSDPFNPETGIVNRENSWVPNGSDETLIVDPGDVDNSFLITKVVEPDLDLHIDGNPMPYQVERLTAEELASVEQWINDGAQNDAFFADNVAPIFGTELTLRRQSGKCTWCHYPGAPTGMSVIDVFDPDEGMVNVDSRFGGTIVVPGDAGASVLMGKLTGDGPGAQMPLHHDRLTSAQVQVLRDWIAAGAPNN